jgi:hypothetical protein
MLISTLLDWSVQSLSRSTANRNKRNVNNLYFFISFLVLAAGLAASVLSWFICSPDSPDVRTYHFSFHLNISADFLMLAESAICGTIRLFIGTANLTRWDAISYVGSLAAAAFGFASSMSAVFGLITRNEAALGFGHCAVGFVMWVLGCIFRDWCYYFN